MTTIKISDIPDLVLAYENGANNEGWLDVITNVYGLMATILASTPFGLGTEFICNK